MILQLYNKQIIIKGNESPENIINTKVTYMYELGTNHLVPVLTINGKSYKGDPANVSFDYDMSSLNLRVDLLDGFNTIIKSYTGTFPLYRTFTLGTQEHINVYKALIEANEKIKQLQEEGDVI